jgi:hypothetical protein
MDFGTPNKNSFPGRPVILSVLCIITFCFGILKITLFSCAAFLYTGNSADIGLTGMVNKLLGVKTLVYLLIWISATLVSLLGTLLMWKLHKAGFYIYCFAAVFAYIFPAVSAGAEMMTVQRLFFSSIFIFLFGIHLKFLK